MIQSSEDLKKNFFLLSKLINQKFKSIILLTSLEAKNEWRMDSGSLLVETHEEVRLYITVDEGLGNILLFDASDPNQPLYQKINDFTYKYPIYPQANKRERLTSLLNNPIINIEIISRPDEIKTFFTMCGFKMTFSNHQAICIGSYLTDLKIPDPWILFPEEVDEDLTYQSLV